MTILPHLDMLERAGLISPVSPMAEQGYLFRHSLVHEATYQSLLRQDRRKLHLAVARMIELLYHNRLDEYMPLLAQHYLEGGKDNLALLYFQRSADHAASIYANVEACMHYAQAILIAKRIPITHDELTALYSHYGRVLELRNLYDEALVIYAELQQLGQAREDSSMVLAAMVSQATIQSTPTARFNPDVGLSISQQALTLAGVLHDHVTESRIYWNLMHVSYFTGHIQQAIEYGEQSLALARTHELREQTAYTLNDLNTSLSATGQLDRAEQALLESRLLWRELGNLPMLADNLNSSAELMYQRGQLSAGLELLKESSNISKRIMNNWGLAYASMIMGLILLDHGKLEDAVDTLNDAAMLGDKAGFVVAQVYARITLANLYGNIGLLDKAFATYKQVVQIAQASAPSWTGIGSSVLALLLLWHGDLAQSLSALDEAKRWSQIKAEVIPFDSTIINLVEAEICLQQRDYAAALRYADSFISDSINNSFLFYYHDGILLQGRIYFALGQLDTARDVLHKGIASARSRECHRIKHLMLLTLSDVERALGNIADATRLRLEAAGAAHDLMSNLRAQYLKDAFANTAEVRNLQQ